MQFGDMPLEMMLLSEVVAAVRTSEFPLRGVSSHMSHPAGISLKPPGTPGMCARERADVRVVDEPVFLQGGFIVVGGTADVADHRTVGVDLAMVVYSR